MLQSKECIVIIPVYKQLSQNDKIAVNQAIKMTEGSDIVFIMPDNFIQDESFEAFRHIRIERFNDIFFANILGYNRLMLNIDFYKRFDSYKYMLIHQTDVYLFKPELLYWCKTNYDYIGAPWLYPNKLIKRKYHSFLINKCPWMLSHIRRRQIRHYNNVGNGGLSLRKIDTFIKILESNDTKSILDFYLEKQKFGIVAYNEDVFWSLEGPRLYNNFTKPDWQEAIYFSIEKKPAYAYNLMGKQLPFGCHAPLVFEFDFWKDHLPFSNPK